MLTRLEAQGNLGVCIFFFGHLNHTARTRTKANFLFTFVLNIGPWISMLNGDFVFPEAEDVPKATNHKSVKCVGFVNGLS